jgi:hypothetical protein
MKTITLNFNNYVIMGLADVTPYRGGGRGWIEMVPFEVDKIDIENLQKNLNDGGFGVEKINGAVCEIYENYEGYLVYKGSIEVGNVCEEIKEFDCQMN